MSRRATAQVRRQARGEAARAQRVERRRPRRRPRRARPRSAWPCSRSRASAPSPSTARPRRSRSTRRSRRYFLRHALARRDRRAASCCVAARVPLAAWHRLALPLWVVSLALLVADARGRRGERRREALARGARRSASPSSPCELAKLATVLAVAALLGRRDGRAGVVAAEARRLRLHSARCPRRSACSSPTSATPCSWSVSPRCCLFVAGADFRPLLAVGALGALGVGVYTAIRPYALRRVLGFLDPWSRSSAEGFQLVQSFVAFGRGGVLRRRRRRRPPEALLPARGAHRLHPLRGRRGGRAGRRAPRARRLRRAPDRGAPHRARGEAALRAAARLRHDGAPRRARAAERARS